MVSAYGRGLWRIKSKRARCTKGKEWVFELPEVPGEIVPWDEFRTGQVVLQEPDAGADIRPSGKDKPGVPMLIGKSSSLSSDEIILDENNVLIVRGRGFDGRSDAPLVVYLDGDSRPLVELARVDEDGSFLHRIQLPSDLGYGEHRIEMRQHSEAEQYRAATIRFRKVHLDEHLGEEEPASQFEKGNPWEEQARKLYESVKYGDGAITDRQE
jgi:hypothetical protein